MQDKVNKTKQPGSKLLQKERSRQNSQKTTPTLLELETTV